MGNKTIYVKDEALWDRAKKLAGKDGLSSLIAEALEAYVNRKEAEQSGFKLFKFNVQELREMTDSGPTFWLKEQVAFQGRQLGTAHLLNPTDPNYPYAQIDVYLTKGHKLVAVVTDEMLGVPTGYRVFNSPAELRSDELFADVEAESKAALFDKIAAELGERWSRWID